MHRVWVGGPGTHVWEHSCGCAAASHAWLCVCCPCCVQRFPAAEPMLETVKDNYQMWKMEAMLESHSSSKGNL